MADQILIPFHGTGSGAGELTWGQRQIWKAMLETNTSQSMVAVAPLPPGRTAADLAAELEFYMCRYESMRTRLRFDPSGHVTQVVSDSGEIALHIVDTGGDDPARVARELADRWEKTLFDYVDEWPIRMAAIRHRGVDTHVVVTVCHLACDGMGAEVMLAELAELAERDPATGRAAAPVTAMTPRELAAQQQTPAARRQSDISLRHCGEGDHEPGREPRIEIVLSGQSGIGSQPGELSVDPGVHRRQRAQRPGQLHRLGSQRGPAQLVPDTAQLTIQFDTHYLSPERAEALVREMEVVAVDACA